MHEASLVQGLLKIVESALNDYIQANPGKPAPHIKEIICDAGLLANIEARTLKACFETFAEGTVAEGAELVINTAALHCNCSHCGKDFQLLERKFSCPFCKSENIRFDGGNGLVLQAINLSI